jgi:hypothetical protein
MTCEISPRSRKWIVIGDEYACDGVYISDVQFMGTLKQCEEWVMFEDGLGQYLNLRIMHESELEDEEDE